MYLARHNGLVTEVKSIDDMSTDLGRSLVLNIYRIAGNKWMFAPWETFCMSARMLIPFSLVQLQEGLERRRQMILKKGLIVYQSPRRRLEATTSNEPLENGVSNQDIFDADLYHLVASRVREMHVDC